MNKMRIYKEKNSNHTDYLKKLDSSLVNLGLSKSSLFALAKFVEFESLSVYNLEQILKFTPFQSDYKNIHSKIKRFNTLGLVEKIKHDKYSTHGAVYYRLTPLGLFYILCKVEPNLLRTSYRHLIQLITTSGRVFYDIFISSVMLPETAAQLIDSRTLAVIIEHISQICRMLYEELEILNQIKTVGKYLEYYTNWDSFSPLYPSSDHEKLEKIIEYWYPQIIKSISLSESQMTSLDISDIEHKFTNQEMVDAKTIRFYINKDEYLFKIDDINGKAILLCNDKEVGTNYMLKSPRDYYLYKIKYSDVNDYYKDNGSGFPDRMDKINLKLAISILNLYESINLKNDSNLEDRNYYKDLKIISKDKAIKKHLGTVDKKTREWYHNFLEHEN